MKNSHKTARQNFLSKQNLSGNLSILLALLLIAIPLFMALQFFRETGVTTVSCQQTTVTYVECEMNKSKYFGLMPQPSTNLTQIKSAKFEQKNTRDRNGESTVDYFVTLVNSNERKFVIFQDLMFVNGVRGNMREMNAIAEKINHFINDPTQSSLTISRDLRWRSENLVPLSIVILFVSISIFLSLRKFSEKNIPTQYRYK